MRAALIVATRVLGVGRGTVGDVIVQLHPPKVLDGGVGSRNTEGRDESKLERTRRLKDDQTTGARITNSGQERPSV